MARDELYFEDLTVGQRFVSGTVTVDRDEIIAFATAYDPQPFHLSDEGAAGTLFGSLAASGWHTAAMSMRLFTDSGPRFAAGVIGAGGELLWPLPVRPGDVLRVETEVLEKTPSRSRPERGAVMVRNETRNQNNEVVQSFTVRLIVPRRPA